MGKYAERTDVTPVQSLADIQRLIERYGCRDFAFGRSGDTVQVSFEMHQRRVRFVLPLPDPNDAAFRLTPETRRRRTEDSARAAYEQAVRQRYRALLLTIKAKLESVESNIETFEEAFLAQLVMPNGGTVGQWAAPQIEAMYNTGQMPPLLPESN